MKKKLRNKKSSIVARSRYPDRPGPRVVHTKSENEKKTDYHLMSIRTRRDDEYGQDIIMATVVNLHYASSSETRYNHEGPLPCCLPYIVQCSEYYLRASRSSRVLHAVTPREKTIDNVSPKTRTALLRADVCLHAACTVQWRARYKDTRPRFYAHCCCCKKRECEESFATMVWLFFFRSFAVHTIVLIIIQCTAPRRARVCVCMRGESHLDVDAMTNRNDRCGRKKSTKLFSAPRMPFFLQHINL
uniref:Uncharacterized protein n=1 Tax=Trichogramma kaykai TaxID=54128 RepID=A0ABD2WSA8_9HYME